MHIEIASLLINVESELRRMKLWSAQLPSDEALASKQPFAIDTLTLPEWIQFIFLPRMQALVEARAPLPERCAIAPIAEEYFRGGTLPVEPLLAVLAEIDAVLGGASGLASGAGSGRGEGPAH